MESNSLKSKKKLDTRSKFFKQIERKYLRETSSLPWQRHKTLWNKIRFEEEFWLAGIDRTESANLFLFGAGDDDIIVV